MKTVTLGMFTVGFLILVARLSHFWLKSRSRDWKLLAPFGISAVAFAAAGACVGGVIGTVMGWARTGVGKAGDVALEKGTGASHVEISRPLEFGTLTPFGAVIMLGLLVLFFVAWKSARRKPKAELSWGAPVGLTMGPFLGAVTVTPLINMLGSMLIERPFFS
ncbi:hypothetical protein ABZ135_37320 [Streptomyces sp. NPDC006339]|uniref:hypothetical protein n=1 Tax=Streptomyces sp. NPDC006339 TaxID=3156755 RepID=UPI0033BF805C